MQRVWMWLMLAVVVGMGSCQSAPRVPPADPTKALAMAQSSIDAKDYGEALAVLHHFGAEPLSLEDKSTWYLLGGTALFRSGEPWDAYELFADFISEHSIPVPALADLTFEIGMKLAASDGYVWPFYSDRDDAKRVLTTFVRLYSTRPQMPDALHRLGEMAYEDGNYEMARTRFTQIVTGRYNSVWNTKAAFRVAMCHFKQLEGPEYDLEGMETAMRELTDFLKPKVENQGFRKQAEEALRTVRAWLAAKHVLIAGYYREVENQLGEHYHLLIALNSFPETEAAKRASARLEVLAKAGLKAPPTGGARR